jgi:tRNA A37 threonylcarbamoyladenosine biosynthesis protein TsaE
MEWGAPFVSALTDQYLEITINPSMDENSRELIFRNIGSRWSGFSI